jgi:hypothetical protein
LLSPLSRSLCSLYLSLCFLTLLSGSLSDYLSLWLALSLCSLTLLSRRLSLSASLALSTFLSALSLALLLSPPFFLLSNSALLLSLWLSLSLALSPLYLSLSLALSTSLFAL